MSSSRPILTWAARTAREDARFYLVTACLLALAAALTTLAAVTWWHSSQPAQRVSGAATHIAIADSAARRSLDEIAASARSRFGQVEVESFSDEVSPPGSAASFVYSDIDLTGFFGGSGYGLVSGRFPGADNEMAVTSEARRAIEETTGQTLRVGDKFLFDDRKLKLSGIVRNPADFFDVGIFARPGSISKPASQWLYFRATDREAQSFAAANGLVDSVFTADSFLDEPPLWVYSLLIALAFLLFASIAASVSYLSTVERRNREHALLRSVGVSSRALLIGAMSSALLIALVAATVGCIVGLAVAVSFPEISELVLGRSVARDWPPLWLLSPALIATMLVTAAAFFVPARSAGRRSVLSVLTSARPPVGAPKGPPLLAALMVVAGIVIAFQGFRSKSLLAGGIGGFLLAGSALLLVPRVVAAASRVPLPPRVTVRLAVRNATRYRHRTSVSMIAMAVLLAIPLTVSLLRASDAAYQEAMPPLMPLNTALIVDSRTSSYFEHRRSLHDRSADDTIRAITAVAGSAEVIAVRVPVARNESGKSTAESISGISAVFASDRVPGGVETLPVWIATPQLMKALGARRVDDESSFVTTADRGRAGEIVRFADGTQPVAEGQTLSYDGRNRAESIPDVLVTRRWVEQAKLGDATCCWFLKFEDQLARDRFTDIYASTRSPFAVVLPLPRKPVELASTWLFSIAVLLCLLIATLTLTLGRDETAREIAPLRAIGVSGRMIKAALAWQTFVVSAAASTFAIGISLLLWLTLRLSDPNGKPFAITWHPFALLASVAIGTTILGVAISRVPSPMSALRRRGA